MKISIIIPTYERQCLLKQTLVKLQSQMSMDFEVIVIDDSENDFSEKIAQAFPRYFRYFHLKSRATVSEKRNIGAKWAEAPYLIFLDDDDDITETWLVDFYESIPKNPDLVFCKMKVELPNGKFHHSKVKSNQMETPIPGNWMIRAEIFQQIGGFDPRLKFAENTELFFRLDQLLLNKVFIPKENFTYKQSVNGGSKSLINITNSTLIVLEKHYRILNNHVKHLYHQILGVNGMRFQDYSFARKHLLRSWRYKPYKFGTLVRLIIACIPFLAKKLYPNQFLR